MRKGTPKKDQPKGSHAQIFDLNIIMKQSPTIIYQLKQRGQTTSDKTRQNITLLGLIARHEKIIHLILFPHSQT
jgi:hypothetical protein